MENIGSPHTSADKRNLLSSVFIGLLLALAYQEMVPPARESFRSDGPTFGLAILLSIFFLTTMRFFIGAILHLVSDDLVKLPGGHWFIDFMVISVEMTIIIFMGGLVSIDANRSAKFGFFGLLTLLYLVDVLWIFGQWLAGKVKPDLKRPFIPSRWGYLNTVLIVVMLVAFLLWRDLYAFPALIVLGIANVGAFVVDVILIDQYKVLRP